MLLAPNVYSYMESTLNKNIHEGPMTGFSPGLFI